MSNYRKGSVAQIEGDGGRGVVSFSFGAHKKCHHSSVDSASIVCMVSQSKMMILYDIGGWGCWNHSYVRERYQRPELLGASRHASTHTQFCMRDFLASFTHTTHQPIHSPLAFPLFLCFLFFLFFIIYISFSFPLLNPILSYLSWTLKILSTWIGSIPTQPPTTHFPRRRLVKSPSSKSQWRTIHLSNPMPLMPIPCIVLLSSLSCGSKI